LILQIRSLLVMTLLSASFPAMQAQTKHCSNVQIPVSLASNEIAAYFVTGTLCLPDQPQGQSLPDIDILTPGTTYNKSYWDWPQTPGTYPYSYVDKVLSTGRAALAYNRIGTGGSSHPSSTMVTVQADAYVLHQIVSWTKAQGYNQVNLIGHSYGSIVTAQEAGTYNDATRVVLTGLTHALDGAGTGAGVGLPLVIASLYPATLDPQFFLSTLDVGYLTTLPGSRNVFYSSSADPAVITYDEAHKDLFSEAGVTSEATTFFVPAPLNTSNAITEPVLLLLGQEDALFCTLPAALDCSSSDSLLHAEQPYYTAAASLTAKIVPKTGHDVALHPSAPQSFQMIETWIETH